MVDKYIQYGCGWSAPAGWRNFDASPTLRFERIPLIGKIYTKNKMRFPDNVEYGDIVKGLPVEDSSCEAVYCSHVLEHLSYEDFRRALNNTIEILGSGGIYRLVVPDLEYYIQNYMNSTSPDSAKQFLMDTYLGREKRNRGLKGMILEYFGNSHHLWMWDYNSIEKELAKVGFVDIRRAVFGDSADKIFESVEDEGRWIHCLGVECRKPG
jgi:predicted SAM-dependent methyltransferase